jgi:hypothetical protein
MLSTTSSKKIFTARDNFAGRNLLIKYTSAKENNAIT